MKELKQCPHCGSDLEIVEMESFETEGRYGAQCSAGDVNGGCAYQFGISWEYGHQFETIDELLTACNKREI